MKTVVPTTEAKAAEQALRLCEQRYQALLASTSDYVYTVTMHHGRWAATSHGAGCEAVTGFTSRELEADSSLWYRMIFEEDRPAVMAQVSSIAGTSHPRPLEHRIIHKDGDIRWIRNVPVPQRDLQGRIVSYDGLISDITDRKKAEEHLRHASAELTQSGADLKATGQELKATHEKLEATELQLIQAAKMECIGSLAAGVAHEVKNPLQTMLMGLDYLRHNLSAHNGGIAEALHDMRQAVQRANTIVHGLLELATDAKYETQAENLNSCVAHSLDLVHYEFEAAQITVLRQFAAELPAVLMDSTKMEQAFINLLINAVQAMPPGGFLTVATRTSRFGEDFKLSDSAFPQFKLGDRLVIVDVQDSGPGIPEADLPRLFDPFFTTKPVGIGTGLGLSVIKKIVDLHCGAIEIKNLPQGGALATVVLRVEPQNNL